MTATPATHRVTDSITTVSEFRAKLFCSCGAIIDRKAINPVQAWNDAYAEFLHHSAQQTMAVK